MALNCLGPIFSNRSAKNRLRIASPLCYVCYNRLAIPASTIYLVIDVNQSDFQRLGPSQRIFCQGIRIILFVTLVELAYFYLIKSGRVMKDIKYKNIICLNFWKANTYGLVSILWFSLFTIKVETYFHKNWNHWFITVNHS